MTVFTMAMVVNLQDLDAVAEWLQRDHSDIWERFGSELPPCVLFITMTTDPAAGGNFSGRPLLLFRFSEKNYIDSVYWDSLENGDIAVTREAAQLSVFTISLTRDDTDQLPEVGHALDWFATRFAGVVSGDV